LRARLGAAGRARVLADFTMDGMAARAADVYEQVRGADAAVAG
jgi:hypothetical protein